MSTARSGTVPAGMGRSIVVVTVVAALTAAGTAFLTSRSETEEEWLGQRPLVYSPVQTLDTSGTLFSFYYLKNYLRPWQDATSLEEIRETFARVGYRSIELLDEELAQGLAPETEIKKLIVQDIVSPLRGGVGD